MKIGILFDAGSADWNQQDVAAVMANVNEVQAALRVAGHEVVQIPVELADVAWLRKVQRQEAIFNLCEGVNGYAKYEDFAVAALELTRIPFTGCASWPVTICHRKHIANTLLLSAGVPVPTFMLAKGITPPAGLRYPVIVKPSGEDASVGIDLGAVCQTRKALRDRLAQMLEQWNDVLIQEYIPGREVNVGFIGREMMPVSEIIFTRMPQGAWPIVTYAGKWNPESPEYAGSEPVCPADLFPELGRRVAQVAKQAWETLAGSEGYGRVDLRVTDSGEVFVLEVNPNPDLSSDAGFARMAAAKHWGYAELVQRVLDEGLRRFDRARAAEALTQNVPA